MKRALVLLGVLLAGCLGPAPPPGPGLPPGDVGPGLRPDLAEDVRAELLRSYRAYVRLAGAHDELQPLSGQGRDFFAEGHPVALTTIEVLDTLYLMGFDAELAAAVDVAASVSFDLDADFQVFETIIRVVGGLLSGYHATGDPRLLAKAQDLTDRLMPAFERSPTGMPWRYVNLRTGAVSGNVNVLAEVGTNIAEFGDLSLLTGDPRYLEAAKGALRAVYERRSGLDLVGTEIDIETGQWVGVPVQSTINPPVDSFYEYLWDGWDLLGGADLRAWYEDLTDALVARQAVRLPAQPSLPPVLPAPATHLWFSTAEYQTGAATSMVQSELAAFYAGLLAQSGRVELGRAYHDAWADALERGGWRILPECLDPATLQALCTGNSLRPEYVDAAFFLWLATGDEVYVDRAAAYYEAMKATSRVANGYTVLRDVTTRPEVQGDLTSAYWFSENMKYYYLMFGRPARFDYEDNYLTTEGNVLRGLRR